MLSGMRVAVLASLVAAVLAVLAVLAREAAAQKPVAAAELRLDIDGDGKTDVVRVEDTAIVSVAITGAAGDAPWKAFRTTGEPIREASLDARTIGKRTVLLARAEFGRRRAAAADSTEVMVLVWNGGALDAIAQETVGPQGRDGEWSQDIALTDSGVIRFQGRPGVSRCDGKPAYLFAELYDFKRKAFRRSTLPVMLPDDATKLSPMSGARATARTVAFRFAGASTDDSATSAADLGAPRELEDGDTNTAWRGLGRGQFATALQRSDHPVVAIRVVSRGVTELGVLLGDRAFRVPLAAAASEQWIELDPPVTARCATFVISKLGKRASISELAIYTELELSKNGGADVLAAQIAAGKQTATAVEQLSQLGPPGPTAIVDALHSASNETARQRLRMALAGLARRGIALAPQAINELVRGCASPRAKRTDLMTCTAALQRMPPDSAAAAAATMVAQDTATDAARRAGVDLLGGLAGEAAMRHLIALAGTGSRTLRRHVAHAIGGRDAAELPALVAEIESAASTGAEADLWRATGLLAARASERDVAVAAMVGRLAATDDYELRYRLLGAIGPLDAPAALDAVAAVLAGGGESARDLALRRVAIAALGRNASTRAEQLIAGALDSADPGTRIAAVDALADRDALGEATETGLIALLSGDVWPRARRSAAGALGTRCARAPVADALLSAVDDDDFGVQTTALTALAACGDARIDGVLAGIAADRKRESGLRTHAIQLLGERPGEATCTALARVTRNARKNAWSDQAAIAIASAGLAALSNGCGDAATEIVLDAAHDDAFPDIQIAAIHALGARCPAGARKALLRASRLDHRSVKDAARRALRRCTR